MAWHAGSSCIKSSPGYVPSVNLNIVLSKLSNEYNGKISKCLFFAGEIDCRDVIYNSFKRRNIYKTLDHAIEQTALKYIDGMWHLANKYGLEFYIVSVTPPTLSSQHHKQKKQFRRGIIVKKFNKMLMHYVHQKSNKGYSLLKYVNLYDKIVSPKLKLGNSSDGDYGNSCLFLKEEFVCDDIHANSNIINPLHELLLENTFYSLH